jgi:hypothetical protein
MDCLFDREMGRELKKGKGKAKGRVGLSRRKV